MAGMGSTGGHVGAGGVGAPVALGRHLLPPWKGTLPAEGTVCETQAGNCSEEKQSNLFQEGWASCLGGNRLGGHVRGAFSGRDTRSLLSGHLQGNGESTMCLSLPSSRPHFLL